MKDYRVNLGWSRRKIALEAGISPLVVKRAEDGLPIRPDMAKAIADALSRGLKREIKPLDLEGLNIV